MPMPQLLLGAVYREERRSRGHSASLRTAMLVVRRVLRIRQKLREVRDGNPRGLEMSGLW
jgi:hypothetical protein